MTEILITGATGFVGSHLVELLGRRGLRARALVRATSDTALIRHHGLECVPGDVTDSASLTEAVRGADVVMHLAGATRALTADEFFRVNAGGTRNLLAALGGGDGRRVVLLSSLAAAGPARGREVRPGDEPRPLTAYGRSKVEAERLVLGHPGISGVVLRPPAVYGPRDRDLLTFFKLARWGILPALGGADRRLQMVHATDVAEAVMAAAEGSATGIFHIAEPTSYAWGEVLDRVARAVGRAGVRVRVPGAAVRAAAGVSELIGRMLRRPGIFDRDKASELLADAWLCETDAAFEAFGFRASVPLGEGLKETADWYTAHGWLQAVGGTEAAI